MSTSRKTSFTLALLLFAGHAPTAVAQYPGTFRATGRMTTARGGHTTNLLLERRVLIAGGLPNGEALITFEDTFHDALLGNANTSVELYHPSTGSVTPAADAIPERLGTLPTLLANGKVLFSHSHDIFNIDSAGPG